MAGLEERVKNTLRQKREEKGWSAHELADKAGITAMYIYDIELGRRTPSLKTLSKIAEALDVSLAEIFGAQVSFENGMDKRDIVEIPVFSVDTFARRGVGHEMTTNGGKSSEELIGLSQNSVGQMEPLMPFALIIEGDSMENAGIPSGARIIVNPNEPIKSGDACVLRIGEEITVRYILNRGDGSTELRAANPNYSSVTATVEEVESEWVKAIGKVMGVLVAPKRLF